MSFLGIVGPLDSKPVALNTTVIANAMGVTVFYPNPSNPNPIYGPTTYPPTYDVEIPIYTSGPMDFLLT